MSTFEHGWNASTEYGYDGGFNSAQGYIGVGHDSDGALDARSMWANGRVGAGSHDDGSFFWGAQGGAQSAGMSWDPAASGESGFWGGFTAGPQVGAHAYANDSMASIGYVQNSASVRAGYRQVGESDHDRGLCLGFGTMPLTPKAPGGMGARAHYGDADGDGNREFGFGASVPLGEIGIPGTGSFDYTTESPILDGVALMALGAPVAGAALAGAGAGAKLDEEYGLSDSLAGVQNTYGTRGAPKFPSEMTPEERFFQEWFGG